MTGGRPLQDPNMVTEEDQKEQEMVFMTAHINKEGL